MIINQISQWGSKHPKKLFLIDGFGALLSAFLLGVVLVELESIFGIPRPTLYFLAVLPMLFSVYDLFCYRIIRKNLSPFLRAIAVMNLAYSIISIGLAFYHFQQITFWGWAYLLGEIAIVIFLAAIEWNVAGKSIDTSTI